MNHILVPVDLSENSRQAADLALDLASHMQAGMVILNAYHPFPQAPEVGAFIGEKELDHLGSHARKQLKEWAEPYIRSQRTRGTIRLEEGWPAQTIIRCARELDTSMIVMGRKGMNAVERVLLGSVSMGVIKKTKWPVMLVPERWAQHAFKRIVFATDYRKGDMKKTEFLVELAQAYDAELIVLHAHASDHKNAFETDLLEAYRDSLLSRVRYDKLRFEVVTSRQGAEHAVHDFVKRAKVDLLAVARTKDRFFHRVLLPGFTEQALRHADVPLLVFPNAGALMTYPEIRISQRRKSESP
jgi:nucleotide-binding universal stress UspA family protein